MEIRDIVGWLVTVILAGVIYFFFQRHQVRIARHGIVRQLEEDIAKIFASRVVRIRTPDESVELEAREFRAVLDNVPPWSFEEDVHAQAIAGWRPPVCLVIDGQRHWFIRTTPTPEGRELQPQQFLASQAFQEALLWFKRVNRARSDKVVRDDDLLDLWRFILPFGFGGRIAYLARYFQGAEDVRSVADVINATLRAGLRRSSRRPLHYFRSYVTEPDLDILRADRRSRRLHLKVAGAAK